jgi:hypothetical protein
MTGVPLKDKTEETCTTAVMQTKAVYARNNHELKQLVLGTRDCTHRRYFTDKWD